MPEIRRRKTAQRRGLTPHELMNLTIGPPFHQPYDSFTEAQWRAFYAEHRDELLGGHLNRPPELFWLYEPGVPDELRTLPDYDGDIREVLGTDDPAYWEKVAGAHHRGEQAREEWLLKRRFFGEG